MLAGEEEWKKIAKADVLTFDVHVYIIYFHVHNMGRWIHVPFPRGARINLSTCLSASEEAFEIAPGTAEDDQ
jgi:hypothetical protein